MAGVDESLAYVLLFCMAAWRHIVLLTRVCLLAFLKISKIR